MECGPRGRKERISGEERSEVEGLPTEWNHNLLTGGWKRGGQVRCEVKAVTTRSPLLRREMIIHPLAHRALAAAAATTVTKGCAVATVARRLTLNERFHLKTLPALSRAPTTRRELLE